MDNGCHQQELTKNRNRREYMSKARRGTAAVEFGLVAPLIFMVLFASIEFGRMLMVYHGLESAARAGCRVAISLNATEEDISQTVDDHLKSFGMDGYSMETDPAVISSASQWDPVTVTVEVHYEDVSWLPMPRYLKENAKLTGSCTLPKESENDEP
jgi:Flp pilus assembly protein TadG